MTDHPGVFLRRVLATDLPIFFQQQLNADANFMAAFTRRDPSDREDFDAHWTRVLGNKDNTVRTILHDDQIAGYVASFPNGGRLEVTYWLGKAYWGQGVATRSLLTFLQQTTATSVYARVAKDNHASIRVLEKCGFVVIGDDKGFAHARGEKIEEYILKLDSDPQTQGF